MRTILRLILTPICTAASAALAGWLARHFPGITLPARDLSGLMVAGGAAGAAGALHWLHSQPKLVQLGDEAKVELEKLIAAARADAQAGPAFADVERVLRAHTSEIIDAIGRAVHAPPSVEQVLEAIAANLAGKPPVPVAVASEVPVPEPAPVVVAVAPEPAAPAP